MLNKNATDALVSIHAPEGPSAKAINAKNRVVLQRSSLFGKILHKKAAPMERNFRFKHQINYKQMAHSPLLLI